MQKYDLHFSVFDLNNTSIKTDEFNLTVFVFNNSSPGFKNPLYEFQIPENLGIGTIIGNITALTINKEQLVYFSLNNQFSNLFAIRNVNGSGQITVAGSIDREVSDRYLFTICVTDKGSLQGCAQVSITVSDVNDNNPKFSFLTYTLTISEKVPRNFVLFKFSAQDNDIGRNGLVTYSIDSIYSGVFYLNSTNGELQLIGQFDYERQRYYNIPVIAFDSGSPPNKGNCSFEIIVLDVNDNSPIFTQNGSYSKVIDENFSLTSVVLTVHADDADFDLANRKIIYSLLGDAEGFFGIDSLSGEINLISMYFI